MYSLHVVINKYLSQFQKEIYREHSGISVQTEISENILAIAGKQSSDAGDDAPTPYEDVDTTPTDVSTTDTDVHTTHTDVLTTDPDVHASHTDVPTTYADVHTSQTDVHTHADVHDVPATSISAETLDSTVSSSTNDL